MSKSSIHGKLTLPQNVGGSLWLKKLELEEGDKVSIFLLDKNARTYSIEVEKAPRADPEPDQPRIKLDLNQPASPT
ncbi:hypothetical protein SLEP1_g21346 [Rubroshorea leprosula]|uniref:Uncharacterized protein n=1 Tax=Rubroshorea leprosula TaxID=152421 RepID=A0AAV5JES3_9ROSI|nr:hypothetical protein SLEP1_g21346 [Rubroshorea leprosula]